MTPQSELDRLRELLAKATPGPWFQGYGADDDLWNGDAESRHKIWPDHLGIGRLIAKTGTHFTGWIEQDDTNAALIVALRNGADELLDEVERLKATLAMILMTAKSPNPKEQTDG